MESRKKRIAAVIAVVAVIGIVCRILRKKLKTKNNEKRIQRWH